MTVTGMSQPKRQVQNGLYWIRLTADLPKNRKGPIAGQVGSIDAGRRTTNERELIPTGKSDNSFSFAVAGFFR